MILVACAGNIFLGDDGFGSEVARRLAARPAAPRTRVVDFGIRGMDLAYALMENYEAVFIIDAVSLGGSPGTIYVLAPDLDELDQANAAVEPHTMDPMRALALAQSMGANLENVRVIGCEPETFGPPEEGRMGLSPAVDAAVGRAVEIIERLIRER